MRLLCYADDYAFDICWQSLVIAAFLRHRVLLHPSAAIDTLSLDAK